MQATQELSEAHGNLLAMRGIDYALAQRMGLHSVVRGGTDWLAIPYFVGGEFVRNKYRTLGDKKQFSQDAGAKQSAWNQDCLLDATLDDEPVVIVEGELDALSAIQAGFIRTISVPGGAPAEASDVPQESKRYEWLRDLMPNSLGLSKAKKIILAVDNDGPGASLFADLKTMLGAARCYRVTYPYARGEKKRLKDLNEVLQFYGESGVRQTLQRAEPVPVGGLFRLGDLPPVADQKAYAAQIPGLAVNLRCGDFSVFTGYPNLGKSTAVNDLICGIVMRYDVSAMFASFEQLPQRDHRRNLRRWYWQKPESQQHPDERKEADAWIDRRFGFVVASESEDATLEWLLERMEAAAMQMGCKLFVIDPWNEIEHRRDGNETQTEYIGRAIRALKRFARAFDVHVMVVAHPSKTLRGTDGKYPMPSLRDVAESAHFNNKPDLGIVIHADDAASNVRTLAVVKSRYRDEIGQLQAPEVQFDFFTGRFKCDSTTY